MIFWPDRTRCPFKFRRIKDDRHNLETTVFKFYYLDGWMEHLSRRRWTTIPVPWGSYSVHEGKQFLFQLWVDYFLSWFTTGLVGCSSPDTKVLHGWMVGGRRGSHAKASADFGFATFGFVTVKDNWIPSEKTFNWPTPWMVGSINQNLFSLE